MDSIKRGDVFLVNFDPTLGAETKKTRPAVVVSNDIANTHSPIVSIAPLSSKIDRIYSFEVEVPSGASELKLRSKIMINQTRAVDKSRLIKKLGNLSETIMNKVNDALMLHFSIYPSAVRQHWFDPGA
jgi:mRNA interferase MazF